MTELSEQDLAELDALVSAYAAAVDARDWAALGDLFTEDAALVTPDPPRSLEPVLGWRGRAEIVAAVSEVAAFASTSHVVVSSEWEPSGSGALGRTTGEAHHRVEGPDPHSWVWDVLYQDRCVRTGDGWKLSVRALTVLKIEKLRPW
ncbi:MAG: nuclear transport factor 2 family protein [Marmoricola sp.]